jgi:hypothetical protein
LTTKKAILSLRGSSNRKIPSGYQQSSITEKSLGNSSTGGPKIPLLGILTDIKVGTSIATNPATGH